LRGDAFLGAILHACTSETVTGSNDHQDRPNECSRGKDGKPRPVRIESIGQQSTEEKKREPYDGGSQTRGIEGNHWSLLEEWFLLSCWRRRTRVHGSKNTVGG